MRQLSNDRRQRQQRQNRVREEKTASINVLIPLIISRCCSGNTSPASGVCACLHPRVCFSPAAAAERSCTLDVDQRGFTSRFDRTLCDSLISLPLTPSHLLSPTSQDTRSRHPSLPSLLLPLSPLLGNQVRESNRQRESEKNAEHEAERRAAASSLKASQHEEGNSFSTTATRRLLFLRRNESVRRKGVRRSIA